MVVADEADGGIFGGGDEFEGEEGHVFGFEDAFVVLVVGAFVVGESSGFGGRDRFAPVAAAIAREPGGVRLDGASCR